MSAVLPGRARGRPAAKAAPKEPLGRRIWQARKYYLLMLPGLVLLAMFSVYPMIASVYYSFTDWDGFSRAKQFIGWDNFSELVHDAFFWHAFGRSFWFMAVATPVELILSLLVAIVLNEQALKLAPVIRTFLFVPVVTTTAIVGIVMSFVLAAFNGPVNQALQAVHLIKTPVDYLGNPHSVMWSSIAVFVWKWFGQPMIYWLAGLQTIPEDVYEAARVDGAGWWRQTFSITAPLLAPFAAIITLIVAVGNLQVFAFLQALTGGGPFFSSEVMELYIYRTAFGAAGSSSSTRLGYASAAGVMFGIVVFLIAAAQVLVVRRMRRTDSMVAQAPAGVAADADTAA